MVIVKFEVGEQIAYLSNDENTLGNIKIYGNSGSEKLQTFLKSEMSKRLLMLGCGYGNLEKDGIEDQIKEDYKGTGIGEYLKRDKKDILKIDTSADSYIIKYLVNELCPRYGIKASIIDQL